MDGIRQPRNRTTLTPIHVADLRRDGLARQIPRRPGCAPCLRLTTSRMEYQGPFLSRQERQKRFGPYLDGRCRLASGILRIQRLVQIQCY